MLASTSGNSYIYIYINQYMTYHIYIYTYMYTYVRYHIYIWLLSYISTNQPIGSHDFVRTIHNPRCRKWICCRCPLCYHRHNWELHRSWHVSRLRKTYLVWHHIQSHPTISSRYIVFFCILVYCCGMLWIFIVYFFLYYYYSPKEKDKMFIDYNC